MSDTSHFPLPPELPGEADQSKCGMKTEDGKETDPGYGVFPIIRNDSNGRTDLLGTGFFITTTGLFVTARHVLMAPFDDKGRERFGIGMIQHLPENKYLFRPILRCTSHYVSDVTVGVAAPMQCNHDGLPLKNPVFTLDTDIPVPGTRSITYAYPRYSRDVVGEIQRIHFAPRFYNGEIQEYFPSGRDRVLLPGRCYRTSMLLHAGASGGPVFSPNGLVFGVNSTGYDGTDVSFVSSVTDIFDLLIDDVQLGNEAPRSVRIRELIAAGHILVKSSSENRAVASTTT
jgi:hypothetical protein